MDTRLELVVLALAVMGLTQIQHLARQGQPTQEAVAVEEGF
jgi:hypothetical protein